MSAGAARGTLEPGRRRPVDVEAIEAELSRVWRETAQGGEPVTRACLWNVAVHTLDGQASDLAQQDLSALSLALPSRVILLRTDAASEQDEINASVSADCRLSEGGRRHVCCEEISIVARGRTMSELPALVRSLLAPDVPSALFWLEEPSLAGQHMPDWLAGMDRFIFDSAGFRDISEFTFILDALRKCTPAPAPGDLNWHRIRPWRALTARLYDFPEPREALRSAHTVTVSGDAGTMPYSAALYMGWFGARLGYEARRRILVGPEDRELRLQMRESAAEPHLGGLGSVRFECADGRWVELRHQGHCITLRCHGLAQVPAGLEAPAPRRDRAGLLACELEEFGGDPMLAGALAPAAILLS